MNSFRADLHRLKLLFKNDFSTGSYSSIDEIEKRYRKSLISKSKVKRPSNLLEVDENAVAILNYENVNNIDVNSKPVRATPDGNCLYHAASISLVNNEDLHIHLRLLTSIELFVNHEFYVLQILSMVSSNLTMAMLLFRFTSIDQLKDESSLQKVVISEAISNCDLGSFSSMVCILGLSSVIGKPIRSIYTPVANTRISLLFNKTIQPRIKKSQSLFVLLWSSTQPPSEYQNPNHFVPVINFSHINHLPMPEKKKTKQSLLSFKRQGTFLPTDPTVSVVPSIVPAKSLSSTQVPITMQSIIASSVSFVPVVISTSSIVSYGSSITPAVPLSTPVITLPIASSPSSVSVVISSTSSVPSLISSQNVKRVCVSDCCTSNLPPRGKPIKNVQDCYPNDIGLLLERVSTMADTEKFEVLENVWRPPLSYPFPQHMENGRHWRFNATYLDPSSPKYLPWLVYSSYFDGVFCLPCVLFGCASGNSRLQKLFRQPLTRWNGASKRLLDHQLKSDVHKRSTEFMQALRSKMLGKRQRIDITMNEMRISRIKENRAKLLPILKTVIFCAHQNISLRGHRDDSRYLADKSLNPGNFQALLDFRIDSGDSILKHHFQNAPRNASYRSKTIQNDLIQASGKFVKQYLSSKIQKAGFFALMADEASDCSQTEQMSVVLRYINEDCEIMEDFVGFVDCQSLSAEYMTEKLKETVADLSLNMCNVRGQSYDGAGNMAGARSGVSTRILEENPKALYFHCAAHRLNLAVASCSNIRSIGNMMDTVKKCSDIFHFSTKKLGLLRSKINEIIPQEKRNTLLDVCRTRWLQRIDGLERIQEMIEPIILTLDMIANNHDGSYTREARSDAQGVFWTMNSFEFVVNLIMVRNIISYTLPLTYELQRKQLDVLKAYQAVDNVIDSLQDCRDNVDIKHEEWYGEAVSFAKDKLDVEPSIKRVVGRQTMRPNYNINDPSNFYKISLTIPFLDLVLSELKARFSKDHRIHSDGNFIIPSIVLTDPEWKLSVKRFADKYMSDLPQPLNLSTELHQWFIFWKTEEKQSRVPDTVESTLLALKGKSNWFPNIIKILALIAVVPASSNSCERSISKLRLLKTYLRSQMSQDRLSYLALLNINRDIVLDFEKILDIFAREYPRKMELVNILDDD